MNCCCSRRRWYIRSRRRVPDSKLAPATAGGPALVNLHPTSAVTQLRLSAGGHHPFRGFPRRPCRFMNGPPVRPHRVPIIRLCMPSYRPSLIVRQTLPGTPLWPVLCLPRQGAAALSGSQGGWPLKSRARHPYLSNVCPVSRAALAMPQPEMARQQSRAIAVLITSIDPCLPRGKFIAVRENARLHCDFSDI